MDYLSLIGLKNLDLILTDQKSLDLLNEIIVKIRKCCTAMDKKINLADLLEDQDNLRSFARLFGENGLEIGLQLVAKIALDPYTSRSFSLQKTIEDEKKIEFLYRSFGGWKEFDSVISLLVPFNRTENEVVGGHSFFFINPQRKGHWDKVKVIPKGTLITLYFRSLTSKRGSAQEEIAAERAQATFEVVQNRTEPLEIAPQPVRKPKSYIQKKATRSLEPVPLSFSLQVKVSKLDTFVHAGNAHLIVTHAGGYPGRVEMFVLRDKKTKVQLDADSIWGKEIRNGEVVVFDFYGPKPTEEFLKLLAQKTNKYTQMDKVANE